MSLTFDKEEDEEKKKRDVKKHLENVQWFYDNLDGLREKYGGKCIAVINKKVIDSARDCKELIKRVKKRKDMDQLIIKKVDKEKVSYLL